MRVAIWSAIYSGRNGQAFVTRRVVNELRCVSWTKCLYTPGFSPCSWITASIKLFCVVGLKKVDGVYLVCSRSTLGFFRDLPALVLSLFGQRIIVHSHGSDLVFLLRNRFFSPVARWLFGRCDVIVPSNHLVAVLMESGIANVHVCENFSCSGLTDVRPVASHDAKSLRILWNSNIVATKGFFETLYSVERLVKEKLDVQFEAIGVPLPDSKMGTQEILCALDKYADKNWFTYYGSVDRNEALSLADQSDVICLPSYYDSECQPLAVIDAMCCGRLLILSDTPALRATASGYPAVWVKSRSVEDLVVAIRSISLEKKKLRVDSLHVDPLQRRIAVDRFSASRFDQNMKRIFSTLLN